MRGHIRKRGNKWAFVLDLGIDPVTKKRQQKWFSGYDSEKAAELALAETITQLNKNTFILPNNTKLEEYLHYWLNTRKSKIEITTYNTYKSIIDNHLAIGLGHIELQKLKPLHIQNYYTNKEEVLSQRTLLHHHRILSQALKNAVGWQMIPNNPCDHVEAPLPSKSKGKALTTNEVSYLLGIIKETVLEAPVTLVLHTGLRRGELLALKWDDIDLINKTLRVDESLAVDESTGEIIFKEPKSESGNRIISLSDQPIAILKKHNVQQIEHKLKLGKAYTDNNLVFCREDGQPIHPSTFSRWFTDLIRSSELSAVRFHDLRHTNATILLMNLKVPAKVVSERLGHSNISITLDTYSHVLQDAQKEAAEKMDNFLSSTK